MVDPCTSETVNVSPIFTRIIQPGRTAHQGDGKLRSNRSQVAAVGCQWSETGHDYSQSRFADAWPSDGRTPYYFLLPSSGGSRRPRP